MPSEEDVSRIVGAGTKSISFFSTRITFRVTQEFLAKNGQTDVCVCVLQVLFARKLRSNYISDHSKLKIETDKKDSENRFVSTKRSNFAIGLE